MGFHYIPPAVDGAKQIATGSYTGNATARQIATGFKCSLVIIETTAGATGDEAAWLIPNMTIMLKGTPASADVLAQGWLHAADGFGLSNTADLNKSGRTYYYWAISE